MPYFEWKGRRLFYRQRGEGDLLLILPGNTASSACHEAELAYFSDRYQVVALDFLGSGDRIALRFGRMTGMIKGRTRRRRWWNTWRARRAS